MTQTLDRAHSPLFLGIEGGGTRTIAVLADARGSVIQRVEAGPANARLLSDAQLSRIFRTVGGSLPRPSAIGIGLAGVRDETDRKRVQQAAAAVWPDVPCVVTNDLETALKAAESSFATEAAARVLVLSGTGSCCFGRAADGRTAKIGGWGHLLGDKGSGYEIGLRALKAVVYYYDRDGSWSALGARILRTLQLNDPNDLIGWAQAASKAEIAALATEVFDAWSNGDKIASDILEGAANSLARDAAACAGRLVSPKKAVQFVLAGSVLLKQPRFAAKVAREVRTLWPKAEARPLKVESVWGAAQMAKDLYLDQRAGHTPEILKPAAEPSPVPAGPRATPLAGPSLSDFARSSPTEARNPRSMNLDTMPLAEAIALMLDEEARVPSAVLAQRKQIEKAIRMIVRAFRRGGRLFYVGAGTSGRLGVLDASECPPTFRTPPDQVQGIIAGGQTALWKAVEGAEDNAEAGRAAIEFRGVTANDVVVGIAASGRTPFVWGALRAAKSLGARTILLCMNPQITVPRQDRPGLIIAPDVGPEVLTGSTRLKAGTATKLVLNLLTTLAMVRLGKVVSNLMVDVDPTNTKLRDRAVRIVCDLTGCPCEQAREALERCGWLVKAACRELGFKASNLK